MENQNKVQNAASGLFIMTGLIVLGLMLPRTAREFRSYERVVNVKGLCEREVDADKVIWPIKFSTVGNHLNELNAELSAKQQTIIDFLKRGGVFEDEISVSVPNIKDKYAAEYSESNRTFRYIANTTVTVCSKEVGKVKALMANQAQLINKGIVLTNDWDSQVQFLFEGLNGIKPEMIEEATKNAREAGKKFAEDSGSRLGKIRTASQGTFSIEDRDSNTPQIKKVRVVTYVEYYLSE